MTKYLIWSNEHRAWWGPNNIGYTTLTHAAGRFSKEDAHRIVRGMAHYETPESCDIDIMVLAPEQDLCDEVFMNAARASFDWGEKK